MSDDRVCAVVVHYHPNSDDLVEDLRNLHRVVGELGHVVVVDNGSAIEPLAHLRETVAETGANLIEVGGIGTGFVARHGPSGSPITISSGSGERSVSSHQTTMNAGAVNMRAVRARRVCEC